MALESIMRFVRSIPDMVEESKLVMLIIDGLGVTNLRLSRKIFKRKTYRTVFPSSTPTFFYSFHSLLEPKTHGFLEWYMRFGESGVVMIPPWKTLEGKELEIGKDVRKSDVFPFRSLSEILWKKV